MQDITFKEFLYDLTIIVLLNAMFAILMIELVPRVTVGLWGDGQQPSEHRQVGEGGM